MEGGGGREGGSVRERMGPGTGVSVMVCPGRVFVHKGRQRVAQCHAGDSGRALGQE